MKTKFTFLCCLAMVWCASLTAQTEFSKTGTRWYVPYWYYRWLGPHYSNSKTNCYYLGDEDSNQAGAFAISYAAHPGAPLWSYALRDFRKAEDDGTK